MNDENIIIEDKTKINTFLISILKDYNIYDVDLLEPIKLDECKGLDVIFQQLFLVVKEQIELAEFNDLKLLKSQGIKKYNVEIKSGEFELIYIKTFMIDDKFCPIFIGKKGKFTKKELEEIKGLIM